jgi:hypothetical protein
MPIIILKHRGGSCATFESQIALRPENEELERFRAPQDFRHAFKVNWIYELPFGRGRAFGANVNGFVDRLIGGCAASRAWR